MPIPSTILSLLAAAIPAMTIVGGYNFDYGPADVHDPADRVYPQLFLEHAQEAPAGVPMAGKHTQGIPLTIRALVARGSGDVAAEVAKVLEDLKRLLETFEAPGLLYFEAVGANWSPRLVYAVPAELKFTVSLVYRQSRENPASP